MSTVSNGNWSQLAVQRGRLIEYANVPKPLMLEFEFNPSTITRTRAITINTGSAQGSRGGYDFTSPNEVVRASQGVTVNAESFTVKILLDATDRMNSGDITASTVGVQPELDIIKSFVEPKAQGADGVRTLAALGGGNQRAFSRDEYASVLLFHWGIHVLPVFMTQAQMSITEFLPNLLPYRAEVTLSLQIIESDNPFYKVEMKRQFLSAGQHVSVAQGLSSLGIF